MAGGPDIMKLWLSKATVLFVLILTTTAYGQQQGLSFNFFGGGARSEGMGQAFLAISDDGTAGGWNPAGLNIQQKTLMVFSYGFLQPRGNFSFYDDERLFGTYDHGGSYGSLNYWNVLSPIRVKGHHVVLNLSYTRNFDIYYKFGENLFGDWSGTKPNAFYERNGGVSSINVAMGTRIYKQLSFGIAGNIYNGKMVTDEKRFFERGIYTFFGQADYRSNVEVIDSTGLSGFNTTIGFLYASGALRVGLVARTPFDLKGKSDTTHYVISTRNGVEIQQDDYYIDGFKLFITDTVYVNNMTSKMQMPLMIGLGLGYNVSDNWLVAGDIEYKKFSGKKILNLENIQLTAGGESIETFEAHDPNWSDVIQLRLGSEYLLNSKFGQIPLRVGFRNEAFPEGNISNYSVVYEGPKGGSVNDSTRIFYLFNYDNKKTTGYSVALGTGIHWSQILLDVAYTYTTYKQEIHSSENVLRSENDWKNHHLNLTFTGYF